MSVIKTPITELFGIKHPILLAGMAYGSAHEFVKFISIFDYVRTGMNVAAGPELAAAVTNAGGLGVIGGVGYSPSDLRQQVRDSIFGSLIELESRAY